MDPLYIVTLLATPHVGRSAVRSILATITDSPTRLDELRDAIIAATQAFPRLEVPTREELEVGYQRAETIMRQTEDLGIQVVSTMSLDFPARLRTIPDPPVILYAKGAIECLSADLAVAVVGTRDPTPFGRGSAVRLGETFAEREIVVVSGLAVGCDTAAHQGCLDASGQTIAVMAHGLDQVYPAENRALAEEILEANGCLVSEYPPGGRAHRSSFVERDRLQSGLSAAVVVVETDVDGGTMHTARFCIKQHRKLGCVVHSKKYTDHPKTRGNIKLMEEQQAFPLANKASLELFIFQFAGRMILPKKDLAIKRKRSKNPDLSTQESFLDMV